MELECPECNKLLDISTEDLPECCCDSTDHICPHCDHEFKLGWYAELEIR